MRAAILAAIAAAAVFAQEISSLGGGIVEQSRLAREAAAAHDKGAALDHVQQALTLAGEIRQQTPPGQSLVVPVYKETDIDSTYGPVKRKRSGELTANRLKKDTTVRRVEGDVTVGKLDVRNATQHLQAAQTALMAEDFNVATAELDAIPKSIVQERVQGNMPRLKARENLLLARMRIAEGKPKAAIAPLQAAADALSGYSPNSPHLADVQSMREQIAAYADGIRHDREASVETIDGWVRLLDQW